MKNQYFGDINDYRKYGILRTLADCEIRTTICWMLTENDTRSDGLHIHYLQQPEKYRRFDTQLFDSLHSAVAQQRKRIVDWVRSHKLIPSARYHSTFLTDEAIQRTSYFQKLNSIAQNSDLIFFDPDNGIEVKSKPKGKKDSCKYLYWDEIKQFWGLGYSLLIYQHFPRVNRLEYIQKLSTLLRKQTGATEVIIFKTSTVAFFLLVQSKHKKKIHFAENSIRTRWKGMIEVIVM
jgi:hypothetical protein